MEKQKRPLFMSVALRKGPGWIFLLFVLLLLTVVFISVRGLIEIRQQLRSDTSEEPSQSEDDGVTGVLVGVKVAVDAGHGGEDRGVCYFPDGLIEKEINLDMARRLRSALQSHGAEVFMTRDEDVYVTLSDRAAAANASGADVFVTIHVNRMPGHPGCFGAQTFYFPGSNEGETLAHKLQDELLKIDEENYRTPLSGEYKVLRLTTMPGALVEIAFMTNERDRMLLQGDEYREKITEAITAGIINFLSTKDADMAGDIEDAEGARDAGEEGDL